MFIMAVKGAEHRYICSREAITLKVKGAEHRNIFINEKVFNILIKQVF